MKPLFRWLGGKRGLVDRIAEEIAHHPPALFIEPFVGAGAVGLRVAAQHPEAKLIFNDANESLIGLWHAIVYAPHLLRLRTRWLEGKFQHTVAGFEGARETYNMLIKAYEGEGLQHNTTMAGFMLYLIAHGYNGLWRVNGSGEFNTPFGGEQQSKFRYPTEEAMQAASEMLRGRTTLLSADFEDVLRRALAEADARNVDLDGQVTIYADPPYVGGFDQYTASGFTEEDQRRLGAVLHDAAKRGARIIASNSDNPLIHEIYQWAHVRPVIEARRVAAKPTKRVKAPCVLIQYP